VLDIGFWELIVIAVVTLLVVGPERLPEVARKAGFYAGKIRRFIQSVKTELSEEIDTESLKKPFDEAKAPLHEIIEKSHQVTDDLQASIDTSPLAKTDQPSNNSS
jgi:sec-independent protein translocase protein TatB